MLYAAGRNYIVQSALASQVQVRELAVKAACVIAGCDFGALLQPHRVLES